MCMAEESLIENVDVLACQLAEAFSGEPAAQAERIRKRLHEPLRVAVAGRVKAGKSTLVNALLRHPVAPTDVSECTKVVTWYQRGEPERVEIRRRDGLSTEIPLEPDGTLPRALPDGVAPERVASLQVYLKNDALRQMTVIDTPGLGSSNENVSESAEELLRMGRASHAAADSADAIAFVLNQSVKEDELAVIKEWAQAGRAEGPATDGSGTSAVNAIGVLTRADAISGVPDPWEAAVRLAARQAERIGAQLATVVPVMGLLAQTGRTGALTGTDAWNLERLAAIDEPVRRRLLRDARRFTDPAVELGVPVDARRRLLERLGLYGIRFAIERIGAGSTDAATLSEEMVRRSGIAQVEAAVAQSFLGARRDLLRARSALAALGGLARSSAGGASSPAVRAVRHEIERIRFEDPQMQEMAAMDALQAVLAGQVALPADLREDLAQMATAGSLAARMGAQGGELRAAALAGHARWRTFSVTEADPSQQRIAEIMIRAYTRAFAGASTS
jgi:GTPase SAR1 family protein